MYRQPSITEFFKQEAQKPVAKKPKVLKQTSILDFYSAEAIRRRQLAAKKAARQRYNTVRRYRHKFHREHPYWQMIESHKFFCYCRNELYFFVVDPQIDNVIAELDLDEDYWLEHIHVEAAYQRRGIGMHLIQVANKYTYTQGSKGINVCVGVGENSRYRLTNEGAALITACRNKNILNEEQIFYESIPSAGQSLDY